MELYKKELIVCVKKIESRKKRPANTCGRKEKSGRFLVGKPKRNKPPGRPRLRWQNLKWILKNRIPLALIGTSGVFLLIG
jgi:hypothetical protein